MELVSNTLKMQSFFLIRVY